MKRKIWFLSRSYLPQVSGGTLVRVQQVQRLRTIFDVKIVTIGDNEPEDSDIIRVPFPIDNRLQRLTLTAEKFGLLEDYLSPWANSVVRALSSKVTANDIVVATSGGELGCIIAAAKLKKKTGCRSIANFHDPTDYGLTNGLAIDCSFHVPREITEQYYLEMMDLIVTSSESNMRSLASKYPQLANRISNVYFGYGEDFCTIRKQEAIDESPAYLRLAYTGVFSALQAPELLLKVFDALSENLQTKIVLSFVGDWIKYHPLNKKNLPKNVQLIPKMSHREILEFCASKVDIGFVSLTSDYLGACVPSKIFDYINCGLPMLGMLPKGDAKDIINQNGYGIAVEYNNIANAANAVEHFLQREVLRKFSRSVSEGKTRWSMDKLMAPLIEQLKQL